MGVLRVSGRKMQEGRRDRGAHSLAPGQSSRVVGFDVALQLGEDGEVGLHPVGVSLVPGRREEEEEERGKGKRKRCQQNMVNLSYNFHTGCNPSSLNTSRMRRWRLNKTVLFF